MGSRTGGFAGMAPDKRRAISSKGGIAAHAAGTGHEFTSDEARAAGRKGGIAAGIANRKRREERMRMQKDSKE